MSVATAGPNPWPEAPSIEDVDVQIIDGTARYSIGGFALHRQTTACPNRQAETVKLSSPPGNYTMEKVHQLQTALMALGPRIVKDCPKLSGLIVQNPYPDLWRGPYESVSAGNAWQLSFLLRQAGMSQIADAQKAQAAQTRLQNNPSPNNDLQDRGFYASWLQYSDETMRVYLAQQGERFFPDQIVVVHTVENDEKPIAETVVREYERAPGLMGEGVFLANATLARLQTALDTFQLMPFTPTRRVYHYIDDFHHPADDRREVLGPNKVETPVLQHDLPLFAWRPAVLIPNAGPLVRNTTDQLTTQFLSIAEVRSVHGSTTLAAARDAPLPPEGPSQAYLSAQSDLRQSALANGHVYKNDAYWAAFEGPIIRRMFDGSDNASTLDSPVLRQAIVRFLEQRSASCQSSIQDPVPMTIETVTTDTTIYSDGSSYSNTSSKERTVVVPLRFTPIYDEIYNGKTRIDAVTALKTQAQDLIDARRAGTLAPPRLVQRVEIAMEVAADVRQLFESGACGDAIHRQFEENLYRLAMDMPTVQVAKVAILGASASSDTDYVPGTAPDLNVGCLANSDFAQDRTNRTYCACRARTVRAMLSPQRVEEFRKRSRKLDRLLGDISKSIGYGETHPDADLYYAVGQCRGR